MPNLIVEGEVALDGNGVGRAFLTKQDNFLCDRCGDKLSVEIRHLDLPEHTKLRVTIEVIPD